MRKYDTETRLTPPTPDDLQAVFVYGTLRTKDGQPGWAREAHVGVGSLGTTPGRLYMGPGFPYFVKDVHESGLVVGEVILFDTRHRAYQHMCRVEIGAGYVPADVVVTLENGARTTAIAWDSDNRIRPEYCTAARRIHGGDFHSREADNIYLREEINARRQFAH